MEGETPICRSELGSEGVCCDKQIMSVSIRPHHLLCMLTYLGKGYTPAFVDNYSAIVQRLNDGEPGCHCRNESVRHRDRTATADIAQALGRQLESGKSFVLDRQVLSLLREAFAMGTIRKACEGCEWQILCSKIARNEFRGCHLAPPD